MRVRGLGRFDQFHLAITLAMQNLHVTFVIPKDENIAVAELRLLDRLFERHGPQGYRVLGTNHMGSAIGARLGRNAR